MALDVEALRVAVYRSLASTGRAPDVETLARELTSSADEVRAGLRSLHDQRHLVLDATGAIALAHPFGTIDFGFSVKGTHTLWWGGCVWDSFAIPNLVRCRAEVGSERLDIRRPAGRRERAVDGEPQRLEIECHRTEGTRPPVLESRP